MECGDCPKLARLLLELEAVAMESSFSQHYVAHERGKWQKACACAKTPSEVIHCLLWFEQEMKAELINGKWREHRDEWEDKLLSSSPSCNMVALALYDFESHMLWKAVFDVWRKDRKA